MATIKTPIRIGDDTPLRNFQTGEAVGPDHGGTGLVTSDLTGQAGKVLTVNGTGDGYTLAAGGGGGGGVSTVTGSGVDNTDPANPVINAISLDETGLGRTGYAGDFRWRTSPNGDSFQGGVAWDRFMSTFTGDIFSFPGAFCWYGGADGATNRSFFQSNGEESYFEFGGLYYSESDPTGRTSAKLRANVSSIRTEANSYSVTRYIDVTATDATSDVEIYNQNGGFNLRTTTGALIPPRLDQSQRNALSPSEGWTIYCTDATANDSSTGVMQTYNGSTWKNHW